MIVDDIYTTMGSINFDNRSFSINDEANINIIDADVAADFIKSFNDDLAHSKPLTLQEFRDRPFYIKIADHIAGTLRSQL
jgi:cardiolipin synthase